MKASKNKLFLHKNFCSLGEDQALEELHHLDQIIEQKAKKFIGYPCNFNSSIHFEKFFKFWQESSLNKNMTNNVGDPYQTSFYALNVHDYERKVVEYFAKIFFLKHPWGYVTSSGTEGNEQGLYMGRSILSKYGNPIIYFSEDTHFSITSLANILKIDSCIIHSKENGSMDYHDLEIKLDIHRPALLVLNIGTTFKGAIDRIEIIDAIVQKKGIKNVFYHADAALFGGYLPFYPDANKPDMNFQRYPYDSIAVSGHKFFASPVPLGIFLTHERHKNALEAAYIQYTGTHNITIACSRSALITLLLWWIITTTPIKEFELQATSIIHNARYLYEQLKERSYPAWLNPYSNIIFFKAPSQKLNKEWVLAPFKCPYLGSLSHIVVMQHVTPCLIDQFLADLDQTLEDISMMDKTA